MNVLQILLDDIGLEQFERFGRGSSYPSTPTINAWYDGGIRFSKFYVQQLCSPTRATILVGQHPYAHGIGDLVRGPILDSYAVSRKGLTAKTIAAWLKQYEPRVRTAAIGKWHVSSEWGGGVRGANLAGFDHFSGNLFNLQNQTESYYSWTKTTNGKQMTEDEYLPAVLVREAAAWIRQRGRAPWVMHLAPYSCHTPLQNTGIPPAGTFDAGWNTATELGVFKACIESIDYYLGVLQASIDPDVWEQTIVLLETDNGSGQSIVAQATDPVTGTTYPQAIADPYSVRDGTGVAWDGRRGKDSPFDTGVHTPLIVYNAGSLLTNTNRTVDFPVQAADIAPTILDLYGHEAPEGSFHGRSLKGYLDDTRSTALHDFVYSEHFLQNGALEDADRTENQWMAYDGQYTLIYQEPLDYSGSYHFYDLDADPHQITNLTPGGSTSTLTTAQAAARAALLAGRNSLLAAG